MAKLSIKSGTTSKSVIVFAQDVSSETGDGLTGLAYNTAGLTAYYYRPGGSATSITLANLSSITDSYSSGGFKEVDSANMPGFYRLDIPNACLAAGSGSVAIVIRGATNLIPVTLEIELTAVDNQDAVRYGMTSLPNANAGGDGGLPTVDTNNAVKIQSGTGSNQISLSSGSVTVSTNNDKTGYELSANGNAGVLSQTLDGSYTVIEALKLISSVICGHRSGGGTSTITFKGLDGATTRVSLSVDSNGNSTSNPSLNAG